MRDAPLFFFIIGSKTFIRIEKERKKNLIFWQEETVDINNVYIHTNEEFVSSDAVTLTANASAVFHFIFSNIFEFKLTSSILPKFFVSSFSGCICDSREIMKKFSKGNIENEKMMFEK